MIIDRIGLGRRDLEQLRQCFIEEGFEIALNGKPRGHRPKSLGWVDEVRLIALVCGQKPDERTRWTLRLLSDKWATLVHTKKKYFAKRSTLRKTSLNLGEARNCASPRK